MGVAMLPRLAAMVSSDTVRISAPGLAASSAVVSGTKVISATSLVTSMAEKKHARLRARHSLRVVPAVLSSAADRRSISPHFLRPATTAINAKSSISTVQST